jgi:hypothetical protein
LIFEKHPYHTSAKGSGLFFQVAGGQGSKEGVPLYNHNRMTYLCVVWRIHRRARALEKVNSGQAERQKRMVRWQMKKPDAIAAAIMCLTRSMDGTGAM